MTAPSLAMLRALGPTRAAALWLERLQRDGAGEDDALFREWLSQGDANRLAWDRARDLWDTFDEADEDDVLLGLRRQALTLRPRISAPAWSWYAAAAASIAAILFAVSFIKPFGQGGGAGPQIASNQPSRLDHAGPPDYATAVGQRSTVALADGTKVDLDTDSAINVDYSGGLRLVRLVRGQAFFDVVHDAARAFRVAAGGRVISDLGTRFNVRVLSGETRVILLQGTIGVSKGDDPRSSGGDVIKLAPGQQLITRAVGPDAVTQVNAEQASGWRNGVVQFDDTTLSAAVVELNRYTADQLVIRDPAVGALRISGAFRTGDTVRFAQTLTALYPVKVVPLGGGKTEIEHR